MSPEQVWDGATPEQKMFIRSIVRVFCAKLPPDTTVAEILMAVDEEERAELAA